MSDSVSRAFVDRFRDAQRELRCEWSMNLIEKQFREKQYKVLEAGYEKALGHQKRHYILVYMIMHFYKTGHWPSFFYSFVREQVAFDPVVLVYPDPQKLMNNAKLVDVSNEELVDAVTFSTLPCYCDFFFTEFGINLFVKFLNSVEENKLRFAYARSVFVSPGFLNFIELVLKPVLSPIVCDNTAVTTEYVAVTIKEKWQLHTSKIPHVVIKVLQAEKIPTTALSQAFFEIALQSSEYARLYGLIEANQSINETFLVQLRSLLTDGSDQTILDDLVFMTVRAKSDVPILGEYDRVNVPSLFQPRLFSIFDFNAVSALAMNGSFVAPMFYKMFSCQMEGEKKEESVHNMAEQTMLRQSIDPKAELRHLLQSADPIPNFKVIPEELTVEQFFENYLVRRGSRSTLNRRREYMNVLKTQNVVESETAALAVLANVHLDRKKEIRALSAFTKILTAYSDLSGMTAGAREQIQNLFDYICVSGLLDSYGKIYPTIDEYFTTPNLHLDVHREMCHYIEQKGPAYLQARPYIFNVYQYLTSQFTFERFRAMRADLISYDVHVTQYLAGAVDNAVIKCFYPKGEVIEPTPGKFDKWYFIYNKVRELKKQDYLIDIIVQACNESSPMRKAKELDRGIGSAISFVHEGFPGGELGEDEKLPMSLAFLIICNPPFLVSNLVYIQEFLSCDYDVSIGNLAMRPLGVLCALCRHVPDLNIDHLLTRIPT